MQEHPATDTYGPAQLAADLVAKGALTSDWLPAYEAAPRHSFMPDAIWPGRAGGNRQTDRVTRAEAPDDWWRAVYSDTPITTQWDDGEYTGEGRGRTPSSSSSMPTMVFTMLDALDAQPGMKVLEIGTGTGWNAALLAHRLGDSNVTTVEVDAQVAELARGRLNAAGFSPTVVTADGTLGYAPHSPYDRVLATCSVGHVPTQWIGQSKPRTVMVTPWGPAYGGEAIARLTIDNQGRASGPFLASSAFMRLRVQRKNLPPAGLFMDPEQWPGDGDRSRTDLSPDDVGDWICMFAIGIKVPELFCRVDYGDGGAYRLWLYDVNVTSWATADYTPDSTAYDVVQCGPRRLWQELEDAWRWWDEQGRPSFDRFGLTTLGGPFHEVWLDHPDNPVSWARLGRLGRAPVGAPARTPAEPSMPVSTPDPEQSAGTEGTAQIDVAAVLETVRRTKAPRRAAPPEEVIRKLVDELQARTAALLKQDLGPDDEELKAIREVAEECRALVPTLLSEGARAEAWLQVHQFGIVTEGLLRRWCRADTAGGDYEIRAEEDEHGGFYVWDTVSRSRVSLRNRQGSRPAARLPLNAAWRLTRRLNQGTG